jgi:hypothetical protein
MMSKNFKIVPALEIKKSDEIWDYSNPVEAQRKAFKYLGPNAIIYRSWRKDKKFMIQDEKGRWVHFGQMGFQDYLNHKDYDRMKRYRNRATKIKGDWKDNPYSPNNLSINVLW